MNMKSTFIKETATDKTKVQIAMNIVAMMFSEYCKIPYGTICLEIITNKTDIPEGSSHVR